LGLRQALLRRLDSAGLVAPESFRALWRWDLHNRLVLLGLGGITGWAAAWHEQRASGLEQSILLVIVFSWVLAAMPAVLHRKEVFMAHTALTAGPLVVAVLLDTTDTDHIHLTGLALLFLGLLVWMFRGHASGMAQLQREQQQLQQRRLSWAQETAQAQAAERAAQAVIRSQARWMATISHDVRQPLWCLQLYAQQLHSRLSQPQDQAIRDGVACSLQALETLLSEVLEQARVEAAAVNRAPHWVAFESLFARLSAQLTPCAQDRGLHLAWHAQGQGVWADPIGVERILRNLVLNALEHTERGGVLVRVRPRGRRVHVQVWDSGCGLDRSQQRRVLDGAWTGEQGHRADASPESGAATGCARRSGFGLGLGIVRHLSHLMGAQLQLRSRPGRGSLFEVVFTDPATQQSSPPSQRR
jgi:signal transduction histidine kinase